MQLPLHSVALMCGSGAHNCRWALGTQDGKEGGVMQFDYHECMLYIEKDIMPFVCASALAASHLPVGCGQSMAKAGWSGVE
jgi:hypothetical protein